MTEIILKDIFKSYDQTEVINGVDLKVESEKFLVLVGQLKLEIFHFQLSNQLHELLLFDHNF